MVKQVTKRSYPTTEVAARLWINIHILYTEAMRYGVPHKERKTEDSQLNEMRRLKAELKRVTEE